MVGTFYKVYKKRRHLEVAAIHISVNMTALNASNATHKVLYTWEINCLVPGVSDKQDILYMKYRTS